MKSLDDTGSGLVQASDFGFMAVPAPYKNRAMRRKNVKGTPIKKSSSSRKIAR
jgi:hypothetical protein